VYCESLPIEFNYKVLEKLKLVNKRKYSCCCFSISFKTMVKHNLFCIRFMYIRFFIYLFRTIEEEENSKTTL